MAKSKSLSDTMSTNRLRGGTQMGNNLIPESFLHSCYKENYELLLSKASEFCLLNEQDGKIYEVFNHLQKKRGAIMNC